MLKTAPMKLSARALLVVCLLAFAPLSHALSMKELRGLHNLTPEKFERLFADFHYKFHPEVQPHDQFLRTESGDCDDFATVAAEILSAKGYTPRMIAIRMKGETHVVCYIDEEGGYLDYNTRKDAHPLVPCSPDITAIATKVAAGFRRDWVATYEFTYDPQADVKHLVNNIIPNPAISDLAKTVATTPDTRVGATR